MSQVTVASCGGEIATSLASFLCLFPTQGVEGALISPTFLDAERKVPKVDTLVAEALHSGTESEETPIMTDDAELAFWDSITDSDAAADYSAYLERYPTGNFSALARARLTALAAGDASGNNDEVKLEITYWESVAASDDRAMFRSYIDKYPDGHFKALAVTRLAKLTRDRVGGSRKLDSCRSSYSRCII